MSADSPEATARASHILPKAAHRGPGMVPRCRKLVATNLARMTNPQSMASKAIPSEESRVCITSAINSIILGNMFDVRISIGV